MAGSSLSHGLICCYDKQQWERSIEVQILYRAENICSSGGGGGGQSQNQSPSGSYDRHLHTFTFASNSNNPGQNKIQLVKLNPRI
ncbi:hypothetical protein TYRP_009297 [Tyrophagus putrescentiae]|nr:hypothetical protein TYRP_009297 [Tyrophagus putrescentiae]